MDQDGFSIAIVIVAAAVLVSGLTSGVFHIQFVHAARKSNPVGYWLIALVTVLVAAEAFRRTWFIGCPDCL
jgi:uncharacterized membrane protein YiaA